MARIHLIWLSARMNGRVISQAILIVHNLYRDSSLILPEN